MSFSYIGTCKGQDDGSGTSVASDGTLNIAAGDLLVGVFKWESGTSTIGASTGAGENDFTMLTTDVTGSVTYTAIGYKIAAAANATATVTMANGTSSPYRSFQVLQFRPDSGEAVSFIEGPGSADGSGYGPSSSATIAAGSGTDVVACGFVGMEIARYIDPTFNIGEGAGTVVYGSAYYTIAGYRLYTDAPGNIDLDVELNGSGGNWNLHIVAFGSIAGGGGGPEPGDVDATITFT